MIWVDEMIVFVKSERAAQRVMENMTRYIDQMGLPVNEEKSRVEPSHKATFCGFRVLAGKIRMKRKSSEPFKEYVRGQTTMSNGRSIMKVVHELKVRCTPKTGQSHKVDFLS